MPHAVEVGRLIEGGGPLRLDVPRLVATRLLVQGRSGGGKSWTLRRVLEQTHGAIQHLVIDPEGEFASLRERFDYVLAGRGGDIAADPATAGLLARRLLELRVSAVLDLYELKAQDRRRFVRLFLEALINAPKALWHPALVVLDEAHVYSPEKGDAESAEAVIDLCTRGRKRGFAAVLATQRLSNLSKQAAAQCANVMVGPTFMDIDRKRACEVLGAAGDRKLLADLMALRPGQFWCVGDAFEPGGLALVEIGPVLTHHPEIAGGKSVQPGPPPPPEKVKAVLSKLSDLPREAADEANERARLVQTVADLRREVKRLEAAAIKQAGGIPDAEIRKREEDWERTFGDLKRERSELAEALDQISQAFDEMGDLEALAKAGDAALTILNRFAGRDYEALDAARVSPKAFPRRGFSPAKVAPKVDSDAPHLRAGARRMLETLARHHPMVMSRSQLATLSRFAPRGGTYGTYLGDLKRAGYIELGGREVSITAAGMAVCDHIAPRPMRPDEVLETWRGALRLGARRMLDELVAIHPEGMTRSDLAERTDFAVTGGTFGTYLGDLKRNGLIEERDGRWRAAEILFVGERH